MNSRLGRLSTRIVGDLDSRSFSRLVQTHALASAGDACVAVALAGSVFFNEDPNTARGRVAISLLMTMAPFAVVAPFLGPVIDRARGGRRFVLVSAATARALVCLVMATSLDAIWLYPIAFISLVFSKTHAVAKSASVPEIVVSEYSLVRANSVLALSAVLAGFLAGLIGVGISKLVGDEWVLRTGALIFAASAALALEVGTENARPARRDSAHTMVELQSSGVVDAGIAMGALRLAVGFLTFLIAFDFRRTGAPLAWFGIAVSASMLGSSLGNIVAPRLRKVIREEWMLAGAGLFVAFAALLAARMAGRWANVALALALAVAAGAAKLAFDALVQRDAPSAVQGRSFARFEAAFQLAWVLGALVPVIAVMSTVVGYWMLTIFLASTSIWYMIARRRSKASSVEGAARTPV